MKYGAVEIMAPVGSYESLRAAIQGGADSVYFGIERLNMRSKSSNNFDFDDLNNIVGICREAGVKSYLTLNTVIYDRDIRLMKDIVDAASEARVSAIIASDQSVLHYASEKGLEIHISTQINISNIESLKFYARFADVVVLARELSLEQIQEIITQIHLQQIKGPSGDLIQVEVFAHGALCMAVSGKCYLSLHQANSSANRGACLQICRRSYIVTDKETGDELEIDNEYIMSPKDLCTIPFLDKLLKAGVSVLKIEGRARSPEYVKLVAEVYREASDAVFEGSFNREKVKEWETRLSKVFNRGFWGGYYMGKKTGEWSNEYGSQATHRKIYLGKGSNYFSKIKVAEFQMETGTLEVGDEVIITGPTTGVVETTIQEIRVDEKSVKQTVKGERFSTPIEALIRRSDKLFKVVKKEN